MEKVKIEQPQENPANEKQISENQQDRREDIKARNRIAAKKWRDKKDNLLSELEATNDELRRKAFALSKESLSIQTENKILEEELGFFQYFMTEIMGSSTKQADPH
ncbi:ATF-like basic leucine zipper transcription factor B-ATF-related protein [Histomonas meleagridis]|uniref:ATF-like basic leucine zipper transcription factor B-ATF-related protein n=1 Tax=Histomonas meleagridis TaxID=135588 RepID=UPI00355949B0|nr:ATF-like basic leucine zipper transcription factor B-ATF-related protein [Histomonas meleagridis]KAH0796494.1 ATF-like basic leucine zipper transcription factor B-ATF-related protein [Histomonas meleagridis]